MQHKIVKIDEIKAFTKRVKETEYSAFFTKKEIELYGRRRKKDSLAARYFLKEIIRNEVKPKLEYTDIEISNNNLGKPILSFAKKTTPGTENIFFSISHTKENIAIILVYHTNE